MSELILKNLFLKRGDFTLFADGTFKDGVHLVTGTIGCGKTTLSQALAGFLKADSGSIEYRRIDDILLSMQFPEYHLTKAYADEEIKSWGLDPSDILKTVDLKDKEKSDLMKLSRGELKRLHLACIFSREPDLLILDELFSCLDPVWKEKICKNPNLRKKITVIFTHEQSILPKADYIWEICSGKLNYIGEVPGCLPEWKSAPEYIKTAVKMGVLPDNIRFEDTMEALCRMQD